MKEIDSYWQEVLSILKEDLSDLAFNTWISPLTAVKFTQNTFYVRVHIAFYKDLILNKHRDNIEKALFTVFKKPMQLQILLPGEDVESESEPQESSKSERSYSRLNGLVPEYRFDNFIVGASNNIAHAAAVAVAENPGQEKMYNPLFLYGGVGLGKTHLMHAIGNYVLETKENAKVLYVSCETFTNELITAIREQKTQQFRDKYRELDVLLLDDIQFISDKDATQTEFFHTFNTLIDAKKQLVICSDRQPSEIKSLTDRLVSRLSSGLIYDVKFPDFETRTAILSKKAERLGIQIDNSVLQHIAYTVKSNIREMEGVLNRVVAYSKIVNHDVTIELVNEAIKEIIKTDKHEITVSYIQEVLSNEMKIKPEDLISKKRSQPIATYRMMAMYLCRKLLDESLKDVGSKFGGRDYSTVIHACRTIENLIEKDADVAAQLNAIEKKILGEE
jgi:chromosomal replication initiator protein